MIKVVLADDQGILREGIKFILESDSDISVVGCAANGLEAIQLCDNLNPDIVLMDIVMPVCDGVSSTRSIKEKHPDIKIIILTTFNDEQNVALALKNGADGYVLKDIETDELLVTIKSVVKGLRVIHESAFEKVVKQINTENEIRMITAEETPAVSDRELGVIRLIVYGKSNKEIAANLNLSEGSVRNIISAILAKLKLKDRTQLAVFAVKNNWV